MKDQETIETFIALRAQGKTFRAIAAELHIAKDTCSKWEKSFNAEIAARKNEALESAIAEYGAAKAARIRRLGIQLKKIEQELEKRDFADVPTEKLLKLQMEYTAQMAQEYTPPTVGNLDGNTSEQLKGLFVSLVDSAKVGDISPEQARRTAEALQEINKANAAINNPFWGL